ncbi:MAG: RNA degradosome polyphosphate kinase [Marinisporobacter sp.]|jgi:polyphosphate kinase|nr:RNA degradosome polyphosphate kinase [Marinisporobacter sp.]
MDMYGFNQPEYFINRELSWLEFNHRVLEEGKDRENPLFERIKFLSIVSSNLDEFFMVRVASLKDQVNAEFDKKDAAGLTPKQQLKKIYSRAHRMVEEQCDLYNRVLSFKLKKNGICIVGKEALTDQQRMFLKDYFHNILYPVLTPRAVDASRPFPLIQNKSLNVGVLIDHKDEEKDFMFATVQVPSVLPRLVEIPSIAYKKRYFILLEDVIAMYVNELFKGHKIQCVCPYRITRNADLGIEEEEAEDLLIEIEKSLKKRKWGACVRLEVDKNMDKHLLNMLTDELDVQQKDIYYVDGPIDFTFLMNVYKLDEYDHLKYTKEVPKIIKALSEDNIFEAIRQRDIFLHHPYESFEPVIQFIEEASKDPNVLAIKQTLYRVSGDSPIIKALTQAAERGKQVTVLVELKARFDEENNIHWAKRLEKAGCHVIYGLVGLKTHSKITLVVRKEDFGIKRYVHLGTGNYNDITAKLYTDMGLFTSNEYYGADASTIFNMLSGYSETNELYKLEIAPLGLRKKFLEFIENERKNALAGKEAQIIAKMNSLVDKEIILALYKASSAGVKIHLIVRGVCCLRPGIPGISENIIVHSIVAKYLEHSRIYYFHDKGNKKIYLSSADWMTRNLDRRVEILFPIEAQEIKDRIVKILDIVLKDNVKRRIMNTDGKYYKAYKKDQINFSSQDYFSKEASKELEKKDMNKKIRFQPVYSYNMFQLDEVAVSLDSKYEVK